MEEVLNENCKVLKDMSDEDVCVITKAWLSGGNVEVYVPLQGFVKLETSNTPLYAGYVYRTKKKTIKIGDMEVPEPFKGTLDIGDTYYLIDLHDDDLVYDDEWGNAYLDKRLHTRGLIHLDKESAIAHAKALIKVSGGEV